jgi:hypothetical protein
VSSLLISLLFLVREQSSAWWVTNSPISFLLLPAVWCTYSKHRSVNEPFIRSTRQHRLYTSLFHLNVQLDAHRTITGYMVVLQIIGRTSVKPQLTPLNKALGLEMCARCEKKTSFCDLIERTSFYDNAYENRSETMFFSGF